MKRTFCVLVSSGVVTGSAFACFYWCSRPLLRVFGISEYANGIALIGLLVICVGCVLVGTTVGLFLFPLVLRPFLSSADFWGWIGAERSVTIPFFDPVLERWAGLLYGKRVRATVSRGN